MVDENRIALTPAAELSFLAKEEQRLLLVTIESEQATPSLSQTQRSRQGLLTDDAMLTIMLEQKKPDCWNLTLPMSRISRYFPSSYTPQRMEATILQLLEAWRRRRMNQAGYSGHRTHKIYRRRIPYPRT